MSAQDRSAPEGAAKDATAAIQAISRTARFNQRLALEVLSAGAGRAEIRVPWHDDLGQYAGFLHAGVVGALVDTVCGFAAATVSGRVIAAHYAVNFLSPAVGRAFVARGRVVRGGRRQIFTAAEVFALQADGTEKLVATGETLLLAPEEPKAA